MLDLMIQKNRILDLDDPSDPWIIRIIRIVMIQMIQPVRRFYIRLGFLLDRSFVLNSIQVSSYIFSNLQPIALLLDLAAPLPYPANYLHLVQH
jgi:hypothetical protein